MSEAVFSATVFDFNGVLVDDEPLHLAVFREVLEPLGIEVTDRDYSDRYLGFDDVGAFRAILEDSRREPSDALLRELCARKKAAYMRRAERELRTFPGAAELLRRCATRGPVGIVSGALRQEIELGLAVLGTRESIDFIVSAEDTSRCKPDPEGYELGVAALGGVALDRTRVLVIEDSVAGVRAAKAAGLTCLAVAHSYEASILREAGADLSCNAIGDVEDSVLATLAGRPHG